MLKKLIIKIGEKIFGDDDSEETVAEEIQKNGWF